VVVERGGVEECGAAILKRSSDGAVLLIRTRAKHFELPKGHLEPGETHAQAASRELCEETGLLSAPTPGPFSGELRYHFDGDPPVDKRVRCYLFEAPDANIDLGPLPAGTRERRWVLPHEMATLPLRSENLRPLLVAALAERQPG
jgi:8-oxo-dGTP pyrophosphatase MutT (NUDIX family)